MKDSYKKYERTESVEFGCDVTKVVSTLVDIKFAPKSSDVKEVIDMLEIFINGYYASKSSRLSFDEVRDLEKYNLVATHRSFFKDLGITPGGFIDVLQNSKKALELILVEKSGRNIAEIIFNSKLYDLQNYFLKMGDIFSRPFDNGIMYGKSKRWSRY